MLGLRYTDFIAPLVKTAQEQQAIITAMEAENLALKQAMESENGKLKAQISNLKAEFDNLLQKVGDMVKRKKAAK